MTKRADNIFGIAIITCAFAMGFLFNSFTRNILNNNLKNSSVSSCRNDSLCYLLNNGKKFEVEREDYIKIVNNEIQFIEQDSFIVRRRLDTTPRQPKSFAGTIHRGSNAYSHQLFLDFYNSDGRLIQTIAPNVHKRT